MADAPAAKRANHGSLMYAALLRVNQREFYRHLMQGGQLTDDEMVKATCGMCTTSQIEQFIAPYTLTQVFRAYIKDVHDAGTALEMFFSSPLPSVFKIKLMPIPLIEVVVADARALYAAIFQGSGTRVTSAELVRVRFLTGAHGLRPIRNRIVQYLASPYAARAVAFLHTFAQVMADPMAAIEEYIASQ